MLRGFSFPAKLPDSIEPLRYKNGVESNYQFFDAFIEKLCRFLQSRPAVSRQVLNRPIGKRLLLAFLAVALLGAGAAVGLSHLRESRAYPSNKREENLTGTLLYYVQTNAVLLEQAAEYMDDSYQACSQYLTYIDTASREELWNGLNFEQRESNRAQAKSRPYMKELLKLLPPLPPPRQTFRHARNTDLFLKEIEEGETLDLLAAQEHVRWCNFHYARGYVGRCESRRDKGKIRRIEVGDEVYCGKVHNCLIDS